MYALSYQKGGQDFHSPDHNDDDLERDGTGERYHYRENCRTPGRIIFSVSVKAYIVYRCIL